MSRIHISILVTCLFVLVLGLLYVGGLVRANRGAVIGNGLGPNAAAEDDGMVSVLVRMSSPAPTLSAGVDRKRYVELLQSHASKSQSDLMSFLNRDDIRPKVTSIRQFWLGNVISLRATEEVISEIRHRADVAAVEDNLGRWEGPSSAFTEATPPPAQQPAWDHQNISGLDEVWRQFGTYGKGILVAVLDAGVDTTHPDLVGKMAPGGWAEFSASGILVPSDPYDNSSHGTSVTSIIVGGNASGFDIGVAPEASFIHAKVQDLIGNGWSGTFDQYRAGAEWVIEQGADIVVLSITEKPGLLDSNMDLLMEELTNAGVVPIAGVGNVRPGLNPCVDPIIGNSTSPANSAKCIGVGAVRYKAWDPPITDPIFLDLSECSSYGRANGGIRKPDLVAVGDTIFVAMPGGGWALRSGTSGAAPRVAGVVALMMQAARVLKNQAGVERFNRVRAALGLEATLCLSANSPPNFPNVPFECSLTCPNDVYGTGVLHDSLAMWTLENRYNYPNFNLNWRTLTGNITENLGSRILGQATVLLDNGQRVGSNVNGDYSVMIEAGNWVEALPGPNGFWDWETRIDTVTVTRLPFPSVSRTVPVDYLLTDLLENFVLDATDIFEISGYVLDVYGDPVPGVTITGFPIGNATTDATGFYQEFVALGWTGTLTPVSSGVSFLPSSIEYTAPVTTNLVNQDFTPKIPVDFQAYLKGTEGLHPLPDTVMVGCPAGDLDSLVVSVDFGTMLRDIAASEITLGSFANELFTTPVLYANQNPPADSAATSTNGYQTTITYSSLGGCGVDSVVVLMNGRMIGHATARVKSPDMVHNSPSFGEVDLLDLVEFANHFWSSICNCVFEKDYSECADWVRPDTLVGLQELAFFAEHFPHEFPFGPSSTSPVLVSAGSVGIEFVENDPVGGPRRLKASVVLRDVEPYTVMFISFSNENPLFQYVGWNASPDYPRPVWGLEVVRGGQKQLVLVVQGGKAVDNSTSINLGYFELDVTSTEPLQLSQTDFALVTADVLALSGDTGTLGGLPVQRSMDDPPVFRTQLAQNFPNPFNPTTTIAFSVAAPSPVRLRIYDVQGRLVRTLVNEPRQASHYKVVWDGKNGAGDMVSTGVYFYQLTVGEFRGTKKMVLLR